MLQDTFHRLNSLNTDLFLKDIFVQYSFCVANFWLITSGNDDGYVIIVVGLSACLPVGNIAENRMNGVLKNTRQVGQDTENNW